HEGPSPDFMLAGEAPISSAMPSPAEAALKAASLVSQMVDIDSESGAVIAAAAAAGAAIEAAAAAHDPMTTVKLSRDRILRALNEDGAVVIEPSRREPRARTEPGVEEEVEEIDPVAIAAAAINRLRARARTDFAELRVHYHRHDILVVVVAFLMIVFAGQLHARLVTPPTQPFSEHGLTFEHSAAWLAPEPLPAPAPRLVRDSSGTPPT